MRYTVAIACLLLIAISLKPAVPDGPGTEAEAVRRQAARLQKWAQVLSRSPTDPPAGENPIETLDQKLSQEVKVDFENVPLREAVHQLAEQVQVDVVFAEVMIEEEQLSVDHPIALSLNHTPVTMRDALELLLPPQGLASVNRSGVLTITSQSQADELLLMRVYNVSELIGPATSIYNSYATPSWYSRYEPFYGGSMMLESYRAPMATGDADRQFVQIGGGLGTGNLQETKPVVPPSSPEQNAMAALSDLIRQSTSGPWMGTRGEGGTIGVYDGMLLIRQTAQVHHEIQGILDGLRAAKGRGSGSTVVVPLR